MLKEFYKVRQVPGSYRRLFTDHNFDLYIWYNNDDKEKIVGFQLVYNSRRVQKALTWQEGTGFFHTKIDEGERGLNRSPILVADGNFEYEKIYQPFMQSISSLEQDIQDLVITKIDAYVARQSHSDSK